MAKELKKHEKCTQQHARAILKTGSNKEMQSIGNICIVSPKLAESTAIFIICDMYEDTKYNSQDSLISVYIAKS